MCSDGISVVTLVALHALPKLMHRDSPEKCSPYKFRAVKNLKFKTLLKPYVTLKRGKTGLERKNKVFPFLNRGTPYSHKYFS